MWLGLFDAPSAVFPTIMAKDYNTPEHHALDPTVTTGAAWACLARWRPSGWMIGWSMTDFADRVWSARPTPLPPPRRFTILVEADPPVPLRFPIARVVDVRGPMEPQEDYAADWLREWMASR